MSDRCEECGGSITPHPEAREAIEAERLPNSARLARVTGWNDAIDAALEAYDRAAGGSPTTTPESNTSPENLDSSGETQADLDAPTTEATEQQVRECAEALWDAREQRRYEDEQTRARFVTIPPPEPFSDLTDEFQDELLADARTVVAAFLVTPTHEEPS